MWRQHGTDSALSYFGTTTQRSPDDLRNNNPQQDFQQLSNTPEIIVLHLAQINEIMQ
jgi:uncharacterized protein with HEPN domain